MHGMDVIRTAYEWTVRLKNSEKQRYYQLWQVTLPLEPLRGRYLLLVIQSQCPVVRV